MANAYGMRGAPAVGKGFGGNPTRSGSGGSGGKSGAVGSVLFSYANPGSDYVKGGILNKADYPELAAYVGTLQDVAPIVWSTITPTNFINSNTVIVGKDNVLVSFATGSIQRSTDGGKNWTTTAQPPGLAASGSLRCANCGPDGVWVGVFYDTSVKHYRSTDNAVTWVALSNVPSIFPNGIDVDDKGVWIAVGGSSGRKGMRSTDNGQTWTDLNFTGSTSGLNVVATNRRGTWIAGNVSGLYVSYDDGATWAGINATGTVRYILTDRAGSWVAACYGNTGVGLIMSSTDDGKNWVELAYANTGISGVSYTWMAYGLATDMRGNWLATGFQNNVPVTRKNVSEINGWAADLVDGMVGVITLTSFDGGFLAFNGSQPIKRGVCAPSYDQATQFYIPPLKGMQYIRAR